MYRRRSLRRDRAPLRVPRVRAFIGVAICTAEASWRTTKVSSELHTYATRSTAERVQRCVAVLMAKMKARHVRTLVIAPPVKRPGRFANTVETNRSTRGGSRAGKMERSTLLPCVTSAQKKAVP